MTYTHLLGDLARRDVRRLREAGHAIEERRAFESLTITKDAAAHKRSILDCLGELAMHDDDRIGLSRANLRHLIGLVRATRAEDILSNGGLIGGANDWYAAKLGVLPATVTSIFRTLKRAGFIIPHNETRNHRRSCRRSADGSYSGRGYSLLPLSTRLTELEGLAAELKRQALAFHAAAIELRRMIRQVQAHLRLAPDPALMDELSLIEARFACLKQPRHLPEVLELLRRSVPLANVAEALVENALKNIRNQASYRDQSDAESRQHHTVEQPSSCIVEAWQTVEAPALALSSGDGPHGDKASALPLPDGLGCGLTLAEARLLFAECSHAIPATGDHEAIVVAIGVLGASMLINSRLIASSMDVMGVAQTFWSLVLVQKRSKTHEIRTAPGAYFRGMVAKARKGELNLDRSIWALRQRHQSPAH